MSVDTRTDMRTAWRKAIKAELKAHRAMYQVLTTMASFGDPDGGNVRPTIETLARRSNCSTRTVRRTLAWARANGWIIQHSRGSRVKHRASFYTLAMGTPGNPPAPRSGPPIEATVASIDSDPVASNTPTNRGHGGLPPLSTTPSVGAASSPAAPTSSVVANGDALAAEGSAPPTSEPRMSKHEALSSMREYLRPPSRH